MELKQFDINFSRFHYIIEESGIRLIKKGLSSSSNTFVEYEDIGSKVIKESSKKLVYLILSTLFFVFGTVVLINRMAGNKVGNNAELFHFAMTVFFLFLFFLTRKSVVYLTQSDNTNAIEFIASNRYKSKVDKFIEYLLQTRDKYLVDKYSQLDEFLPYAQQYNNLVWLYNLKLLNKQQLKSKIAELDRLDLTYTEDTKKQLSKIIGFKRATDTNELNEDQD